MSLYLISLPFTSVFSIALAVFVFSRNPKNPVNITWSLTCVTVVMWSTFFCLMMSAKDFDHGLIFSKICNVSAAFTPIFITHFCMHLIQSRSKLNKILLVIGYINCALIIAFACTDNFLTIEPMFSFNYYTVARPLYHFFTAHFFFFFVYHEILFLRALKTEPKETHTKLTIILVGLTAGYIGGIFTFLPVYRIMIEPIQAHFIWLYAAIITYGIVKHGVMDINLVIRKGLVYTFLVGLITGAYALALMLLERFVQNFMGYSFYYSVVFMLIAIIFAEPLRQKIQAILDRYFFQGSLESLSAQKDLMQKEIQKQDRLRSVATLAAGMAHEIKNPLTSLKTFAQYLPTKYNDPEFRERFSRIVSDEVDRVNNIVKQLLEFSKPEEPHLQSVDVNKLIEDTLDLLSNNLFTNKIQLIKKLSVASSIKADKNQLKQVLLNIILNAIQAMPGGGILTVATEASSCQQSLSWHHPKSSRNDSSLRWNDNNKDFIVIRISDTGLGIPKEKLDKIFDPFFTTKEDGTGLGLSIVHSIIESHHGKVEVSSQVGVGAEFRIILPSEKA